MALALRDNAYHTYADYLAWPEDICYELIDGMAYLMAPAPALDAPASGNTGSCTRPIGCSPPTA